MKAKFSVGDFVTPIHMQKNPTESRNWKELAEIEMGGMYKVSIIENDDTYGQSIQIGIRGYLLKSEDFKLAEKPSDLLSYIHHLISELENRQSDRACSNDFEAGKESELDFVIDKLKALLK